MKQKILPFLIILILICSWLTSAYSTSSQTLLPTTSTHPAYENSAVTTVINVYTSPDRATTEMSSGEYSNVQSENGVYASTTTSTVTNNRYANGAQRFTFDTSVISGTITDIVFVWKGYVTQPDGGEGVSAILQYYQGSAWYDWSNPAPSSNTEKTKDIGTGSGYFYSTTWLRFGVYAYNLFLTGDSRAYVHLYTDYAAIIVTYSTGGTTLNEYGSVTLTFTLTSTKTVGKTQSSTIPLSFNFLSSKAFNLNRFGTIPLTFSFIDSKALALNRFNAIPLTLAFTSEKLWSFSQSSTIPLTLAFSGTATFVRLISIFGTIPMAFNFLSARTFTLSTYGTIPLSLALESKRLLELSISSTIPLSLTFAAITQWTRIIAISGTIPLILTLTTIKTIMANLQGTIPLQFLIESTQNIIIAGVLNIYGIIPLAFQIISTAIIPTLSILGFALAFLSLIFGAWSLTRRKKEARALTYGIGILAFCFAIMTFPVSSSLIIYGIAFTGVALALSGVALSHGASQKKKALANY